MRKLIASCALDLITTALRARETATTTADLHRIQSQLDCWYWLAACLRAAFAACSPTPPSGLAQTPHCYATCTATRHPPPGWDGLKLGWQEAGHGLAVRLLAGAAGVFACIRLDTCARA